MKKWFNSALTVISYINICFLISLTVVTVIDVIARYVFNTSFVDAMTISSFLLAVINALALPGITLVHRRSAQCRGLPPVAGDHHPGDLLSAGVFPGRDFHADPDDAPVSSRADRRQCQPDMVRRTGRIVRGNCTAYPPPSA